MEERSTYIGFDVHKSTISVSMLRPGFAEPVEWSLRNEPREIERLVRRLKKEVEGTVTCFYEAGPCGYALQRFLLSKQIPTHVVAPSLIPYKPGERIKTDRRDARKIAQTARAQMLTVIHPPTVQEEAIRDVCRCREDAMEDLIRSRHRLSKMLLRQGLVYSRGKGWTRGYREWLRSLRFEDRPTQVVFNDYLSAVDALEDRITALDRTLGEIAQEEPYRERVGWLRCFRGIDTVTAITILAELHDFRRFENPRRLMSYLGLVPSEHSSGERTQRGAITKAGNSHVRRRLVECSWHYRHRPAVGKPLKKRREGQPPEIIAIADKAQRRLNQRFQRLVQGSKKPSQVAIIAVARELIGFIWAALYVYPKLRASSIS